MAPYIFMGSLLETKDCHGQTGYCRPRPVSPHRQCRQQHGRNGSRATALATARTAALHDACAYTRVAGLTPVRHVFLPTPASRWRLHTLTRHTDGCPNACRVDAEQHHAHAIVPQSHMGQVCLERLLLRAWKNISAKTCCGNRYSRQRTDQCRCVSCTTPPPRQRITTYSLHHAAQNSLA